MKIKLMPACAAALGALLAGAGASRAIPPQTAPPAAPLHFQSSCSLIGTSSVDGYVSNLSSDTYQVQGAVRFRFYSGTSMSRPELVVQADVSVPPGKTARVSHAQLAFELLPGETCRFSVKAAIRKP